MLELGRKFYEVTPYANIMGFDDESALRTLRNLIDNKDGVLVTLDFDGVIEGISAALVFPSYFNANYLMGQEIFTWITPQCRSLSAANRLIQACEAGLYAKGAQLAMMGAIEGLNPGRLAKLYARHGYIPHEYYHMKILRHGGQKQCQQQ